MYTWRLLFVFSILIYNLGCYVQCYISYTTISLILLFILYFQYLHYLHNHTKTHFTECPKGEFGLNCASTCPCEKDHTSSCNHVNGSCTCNEEWQGDKCDVDVDECTATSNACNSTLKECNNTDGSFTCNCKTGYSIYDDGMCRGICLLLLMMLSFRYILRQ